VVKTSANKQKGITSRKTSILLKLNLETTAT